jgi:hypothetical protein
MKKFKDLSIGDIIYVIRKNNINHSEGFFVEIKVTDLSLSSEGILLVNRNEYSGKYILTISKTVQKQSTYNYDGLLYITNKEELKPFVVKLVIEEIKHQEESVPKAIERAKKNIEELRKCYWEYLN